MNTPPRIERTRILPAGAIALDPRHHNLDHHIGFLDRIAAETRYDEPRSTLPPLPSTPVRTPVLALVFSPKAVVTPSPMRRSFHLSPSPLQSLFVSAVTTTTSTPQ